MAFGRSFERLMGMSDDTWERHASPWSVWTRIATWPFIMLALWSPHWIGWWSALPIAALALWTWLNPRLFPPPVSTDNWASKATFGERVWLARDEHPIPAHHERAALVATAIAGAGAVLMVAGAVLALPPLFLAGGTAAFLGKVWFCDRMVWLFEDMKHARPELRDWLR